MSQDGLTTYSSFQILPSLAAKWEVSFNTLSPFRRSTDKTRKKEEKRAEDEIKTYAPASSVISCLFTQTDLLKWCCVDLWMGVSHTLVFRHSLPAEMLNAWPPQQTLYWPVLDVVLDVWSDAWQVVNIPKMQLLEREYFAESILLVETICWQQFASPSIQNNKK